MGAVAVKRLWAMLACVAGLIMPPGPVAAAPSAPKPPSAQGNPLAAFDSRLQQAATAIDENRFSDALSLVEIGRAHV